MFDLSGIDIRSERAYHNKALAALRKIAVLGKYDAQGNPNPNWAHIIATNPAIQIVIKVLMEIDKNENS